MAVRAIVTGAAGFIGSNLIEYISNLTEVEYLVSVEREDVTPEWTDTPERVWVSKNLDEAGADWWNDLVTENDINTIYYMESIEDNNNPNIDTSLLDRWRNSDSHFISFLESFLDLPSLNIVYISTDQVYKYDSFPNEIHPIMLQTSEFSLEVEYALNKVQTELRLKRLPDITLRIIRPFALTGPEQEVGFPLPALVQRIQQELPQDLEHGLPVFEDGSRGITFTHINDLVEFLGWLSETSGIFSQEVTDTLIDNTINFCRVQNYLPEIYLIEKIIEKTESLVRVTTSLSADHFPGIQKTPQIKNLNLVFQPSTPIEMILEDLIFELNPVPKYAPIVVLDITWDGNTIPTISGTAEPFAMIGVSFGDGTGVTTDTDAGGNWVVTKDEFITLESTWYFYATTQEQNQYHTIKLFVTPPQ